VALEVAVFTCRRCGELEQGQRETARQLRHAGAITGTHQQYKPVAGRMISQQDSLNAGE